MFHPQSGSFACRTAEHSIRASQRNYWIVFFLSTQFDRCAQELVSCFTKVDLKRKRLASPPKNVCGYIVDLLEAGKRVHEPVGIYRGGVIESWWTEPARAGVLPPGPVPQCPDRVSLKKSLITLSISYKTNMRHSSNVALFLNYGLRVPEGIFSRRSGSSPPPIQRHGREYSRTPRTHPDISPIPFVSPV